MFIKISRYFKQATVKTAKSNNSKEEVQAITLRRTPPISGDQAQVKGNSRLDTMAQNQYREPTMFWHIADANNELEANDLVKEIGQVVNVPEE